MVVINKINKQIVRSAFALSEFQMIAFITRIKNMKLIFNERCVCECVCGPNYSLHNKCESRPITIIPMWAMQAAVLCLRFVHSFISIHFICRRIDRCVRIKTLSLIRYHRRFFRARKVLTTRIGAHRKLRKQKLHWELIADACVYEPSLLALSTSMTIYNSTWHRACGRTTNNDTNVEHTHSTLP